MYTGTKCTTVICSISTFLLLGKYGAGLQRWRRLQVTDDRTMASVALEAKMMMGSDVRNRTNPAEAVTEYNFLFSLVQQSKMSSILKVLWKTQVTDRPPGVEFYFLFCSLCMTFVMSQAWRISKGENRSSRDGACNDAVQLDTSL